MGYTEIRQQESFCMTEESIRAFLNVEKKNCNRKGIYSLYQEIPEGQPVTEEKLKEWRQSLKQKGCSAPMIRNYVKCINKYLRFMGHEELCFSRGRKAELVGRQFGYLTVQEKVGYNRERQEIIWRCMCRCGNRIDAPSTSLLTGNTQSCGCLPIQKLQASNKYFDGTALRQSLEEKIVNPCSASGYVGVIPRRNKWQAIIIYKGVRYNLGTYSNLEDAVKARARGKQAVQEDARKLLQIYEEIHANEEPLPKKGNRTVLQSTKE